MRIYLNVVREAVERSTYVKVAKLSCAKSRLGEVFCWTVVGFFEVARHMKTRTKSSPLDWEFALWLAGESDG